MSSNVERAVENAKGIVRRNLTWEEHGRLCAALASQIDANRYDSLFPVVRGGICPAVEISARLGLPVVWELRPKSLVIDDICDSGTTVERFRSKGYDAATIFYKKRSAPPAYYAEVTSDWIVYPWESDADLESIVIRQLEYVGEDPNRPGLKSTPKDVVKGWDVAFRGYRADVTETLSPRSLSSGSAEFGVVEKSFEFYSTCERTASPFFGVVSIRLLIDAPDQVDSAALARLVDVLSRRFQSQERLCEQLADLIFDAWRPQGIRVDAVATHARLIAEGRSPKDAIVTTHTSRGSFSDD